MKSPRPGGRRWTRRVFLASFPAFSVAASPGRGQQFPSDARRFPDPATEFEVHRLTDPAYSSYLPLYYGRTISRKAGSLLFASDRGGSMQAFQMDLKKGECRQLTDADALDPSSITLLPDERSFAYFDGPALRQASLSSLRGREIYRIAEGYERGAGFSISGDGVHAVLVETKGAVSRIQLVGVARGAAATVVETEGRISHPMPRPKRAGILYRGLQNSLWLVNYDGQQNRPLRIAPGGLGCPLWSPDGWTVLYLNYPEDSTKLNNLRELAPDTNEDRMVSVTSQFVTFGVNGDASVFVGASRSKASPHVLLLVRSARREFTLCEHKTSSPEDVAPRFAPDSRRVYFQSDRHGKPAIYSMVVDRLVEATET